MREHQCYNARTAALSDYWPWKRKKSEQEIRAEIKQKADVLHEEREKKGLREQKREEEAAAMQQEAQRRADERLSDAEKRLSDAEKRYAVQQKTLHRYNADDSDGPVHVGPSDTDSDYSDTDTVLDSDLHPDDIDPSDEDDEADAWTWFRDLDNGYTVKILRKLKVKEYREMLPLDVEVFETEDSSAPSRHFTLLDFADVADILTWTKQLPDCAGGGMPLVYEEQAEEFLSNKEVHHKKVRETQHSPSSTTHSIRHAMESLLGEEETIGKLQKFASHEAARATAATAKRTELRHKANKLRHQANELILSPGVVQSASVVQSVKTLQKKAEKLAADARKEDLHVKNARQLIASACKEVACIKRKTHNTKLGNIDPAVLAQIYKPLLHRGESG